MTSLQSALTPQAGTLVLSRASAAFADLLDNYYASQPLTITAATVTAAEGAEAAVTITGRSSFLGVADLPITARFAVDPSGKVRALIRYQLRENPPGVNPWIFSRCFPKLPMVWNHNTAIGGQVDTRSVLTAQKPLLDALSFFDSYFVVTTEAGTDPDWQVPLEAGTNFVSRLRPDGVMGVLLNTAALADGIVCYGPVRIPKVGVATPALVRFERPWQRTNAPGIYLQAPLPTQLTLGKLTIGDFAFRAYSPPSRDWQKDNSTFAPRHGFTARLAIPSAGLQLAVTVDLEWNQPTAAVYAQCQGLTLGKLSALVDVAGTDALSATLPKELATAIDALGKLELIDLGFSVSAVSGAPAVRALTVTVGMPSLTWKVWGDKLVLRSIACRFEITNPLTKPEVKTTVMGTMDIEGVTLSVFADASSDFALYARLVGGQTIPLSKLFAAYAPGLTAPSDLTVDRLAMMVAPGRSYQMSVTLADKPKPWVIPVGRMALTLSNLTMDLSSPAGGPVAGQLAGTAAFGDTFILDASCTLPGSAVLRGTFRDLKLRSLLTMLCDQPGMIPTGFDLALPSLSVLISKRGNDYGFQAAAEVANLGTFALEARRFASGQTGFAVGLSLTATTLGKLSGLSSLATLERFVRLQKLLIVLASFDDAQFVFPELAAFNQPALATKSLKLPAGSGGIKAGLNVLAEWVIDTGDKQENLLKTLLGLDGTLQTIIQVAENPARGTRLVVNRTTKLKGRPFTCKFGVELADSGASLFLAGAITVEIQGQPQTFDLTTMFVPGGAFLSATMKGKTAIDCKLFKLSNVGLEIGVDWAGLPSLGVTATIDVSAFQSSVAVFFDSTDPAKSLIAGSVSDLTLKEVTDTLLGAAVPSAIDDILKTVAVRGTSQFKLPAELATDLNNLSLEKVAAAFAQAASIQLPTTSAQVLLVVSKPGESWHLTDLSKMRHYQLAKQGAQIVASLEAQFYCAPQATAIGSIVFPQGFYINGAIEFLGFRAQATIDISANRGISIEAEMDKLIIGNESLFCLAAATGSGGPRVSISSMAQPSHAVAEYKLPHFFISGALTVLGIKQSVLASLTTKGLFLELKGALAPGVEFDLDVTVGSGGFNLDGDVKAGIGTIDLGDLGKIKLNTDVEGSLGIVVNGQQIAATLDADFDFLGESLQIGHFNLETKPAALGKLADTLKDKVTARLLAEFKDVNRWTNALKQGAIQDVQDSAKVLTKVYGKSEKEAKALAGDISKGTTQAAKTVAKTASKFGKKLKKLF